MIIVNSPHNPTGSVMTESELRAIAELAEDNGIFIFSDEIYSKMTYDQKFYSPANHDYAKERTIILDGFSKSYSMTGWRLGYLVAPEALIERMTVLSMYAFSCTAPFVQQAGVTALEGKQDDLYRMVKEFHKRRDTIVKGLNEIPGFSCQMPEGAFYAWPNISGTGLNSQEIADFLLDKAGVACLPGNGFGRNGEGYLRFSYATSIETIREGIERIKEAIDTQ
jgi:aspartate/methionine/tyrosine aminotransferase